MVAYCENQDAPWLVSGVIEPGDGSLQLNTPDCLPRAVRRSTKVGFRVFEGEKMVSEEILDLKRPSKGSISIIGRTHVMNGVTQKPVNSLSHDTLVSICVLQSSLDDANDTRERLEPEINRAWPGSKLEILDCETSRRRKIQCITRYIELTEKATRALRNELRLMKENSRQVRAELEGSMTTDRLTSRRERHPEILEEKQHESALRLEHRRLAKQLLEIFPIEPVDSTFHFTICGIFLPNVFAISHFDPVQVGAALGFVAQVVLSLSFYLDIALPYPIRAFGSQSFIVDNISRIKGSRTFPLWTKGVLLYRVEYGLFLLHKDIEQLMTAQDLPVVDLKQTLANLKTLLLAVSS